MVTAIARALTVGLCAVTLVSCGGGAGSESPLGDALGYLPKDAPAALVLRTDLDSQSYQDLDAALQRFGVQGGIEGALGGYLGLGADLSFSRDIKPLLGNELAIGVLPAGAGQTGFVAAVQTTDGDKLRDLLGSQSYLEKKGEASGATLYAPKAPEDQQTEQLSSDQPAFAVEGDTLIAADSGPALKQALDQRDADDRLTESTFDDRLGDLPKDGLIRAAGDAQAGLEALGIDQTTSVPWIGALRSFGLAISIDGRTASADALISTDSVAEKDLPLVAGTQPPPLVPKRSSLGTRDQSQSMSVGLELVRASVPQATFKEIESRLERDTGGSLDSLIGQFGPGLVTKLRGGDSVTRSELKDPAAVAKALGSLGEEALLVARAAGEGGPVGDALQGASLLIPALPVPQTGYFPEGSTVAPVEGKPGLYQVVAPAAPGYSGRAFGRKLGQKLGQKLPPPPPIPGDVFVFGVIAGAFVTAPSLESAQAAATLTPAKVATPPGSVAFSIPLRGSDFGQAAGIILTTIKGGIEAAPDSVRLKAEASL